MCAHMCTRVWVWVWLEHMAQREKGGSGRSTLGLLSSSAPGGAQAPPAPPSVRWRGHWELYDTFLCTLIDTCASVTPQSHKVIYTLTCIHTHIYVAYSHTYVHTHVHTCVCVATLPRSQHITWHPGRGQIDTGRAWGFVTSGSASCPSMSPARVHVHTRVSYRDLPDVGCSEE